MHSVTIDVDRAVGRASVDEALGCGVHGGEVCPDQGCQHFVASVGHQAVVLRVLDQVISSWVLLPSVVPAHSPHRILEPHMLTGSRGQAVGARIGCCSTAAKRSRQRQHK